MSKKVVVLLSGGIDSSTAIGMAVNFFGVHNVTALTMFYGQKHDKELKSAEAVAEHYGVRHIVRDLSVVFATDNNPLLKKSNKELPLGSYADQERDEDGMSKTYVAFRNGLFLSTAASIAYSIGAEEVFYGAHADDAAGNAYPDCTPEFYTAMNEAIYQGTGKKVKLFAPFIHANKSGIVTIGLDIRVPYELTWSCYEGGEVACGQCGTCIDRLDAFHQNDSQDPIVYANDTIIGSDSTES